MIVSVAMWEILSASISRGHCSVFLQELPWEAEREGQFAEFFSENFPFEFAEFCRDNLPKT